MAKGEERAKAGGEQMQVAMIPVTSIDQGDQLIRDEQLDDEIDALALDIQKHGLMQPIGVRHTENGRYQLLWGARRWLAHQRLRRPLIAAHITTGTEASIRAVAARENLLRRALTLPEEVDAVCKLHDEEGHSPDSIASLLSHSRAWVLRRLSVPQLPNDLRLPVLDGSLAIGAAEAIARVTDEGLRAYLLTQTAAAKASVADVRAMVESILAAPSLASAVEAGREMADHPETQQPILMACAACGTARPLAQLAIVRVCATTCTAPATDIEETTDGPDRTRSPHHH